MLTRFDALIYLRIAGYHEDSQSFMRILTESRVSVKTAKTEYQRGYSMRKAGVPCTCTNCKTEIKG